MKQDYSYCLNEDTCIHRRGCKRWVGNYIDSRVSKPYIDESICIPNYSDVSCENDFEMLDRFRLSTGEEFTDLQAFVNHINKMSEDELIAHRKIVSEWKTGTDIYEKVRIEFLIECDARLKG